MAIAKSNIRQPYLDNLALPEEQFSIADFQFPELSEINADEIEFIIDVDLDDLTVFFADKSHPYLTDEIDQRLSVLVDADTNGVVGVVLHKYLSELVKSHSSLVPILRQATIIAGSAVEEFDEQTAENPSGLPGIKSRLESWVSQRVRREERQEAFASLANLIGLH